MRSAWWQFFALLAGGMGLVMYWNRDVHGVPTFSVDPEPPRVVEVALSRNAVIPLGIIGASVESNSDLNANSADAFEFGPMTKLPVFFDESGAYETIEAVAVGDITGDGLDDLVVQPNRNLLRVYAQRSDGTFALPLEFRYRSDDNYSHPKDMVLADFNGDGVLDVAASGVDESGYSQGMVNLLLSGPSGSLVLRQELAKIEQGARFWTAVDVDGDGAIDIVASENVTDYSGGTECGRASTGTCPRLRVMYGDGLGGFLNVESVQLGKPSYVTTLPASDVDGDGLRDIVYSFDGGTSQPGRTVAHLRQPSGRFGAPVSLFEHSASFYEGQSIGDFTGDGRLDFVAAMRLYARSDTGTYSETDLPTYMLRSYWNTAADFDGDGLSDLATVQMDTRAANWTMHVVLYQQRDGGLNRYYFTPPHFELDKVSMNVNALAAGDINGDGCRDLVIAASYEGILIFPGRNCGRQAAPPMITCDLRETSRVGISSGAPSTATPGAAWQLRQSPANPSGTRFADERSY